MGHCNESKLCGGLSCSCACAWCEYASRDAEYDKCRELIARQREEIERLKDHVRMVEDAHSMADGFREDANVERDAALALVREMREALERLVRELSPNISTIGLEVANALLERTKEER